MEIGMIYRLLGVACAGLWAFILILRQKPLLIETNTIFALVFLVAVVGVTYIETGKASGIIKQISYFMMVICFIICQYYKKQWDELKIIVPVVLILLTIFNFRTYFALLQDPSLARQLVRDDENMYQYLRQGIGGYSLIYPQVCVFPALLQWTISAFNKNKLYFALGAVNICSFILVIFNAGYSIAIFTTAIGVFLLLFYKGNSAVRAFFVALIIFVTIMYLILYVEEFRNWILDTFKSRAVHNKINDLIASAESGDASGSIAARLTRYMSSIRKIFIYPIIGALWRDGGGGHSAVLDTFAKYGLWGGAIYCFMIYFVPVSHKRKYENRYIRRTCNATLVAIMTVSILDSFTYAFSGMILLVLPLYFEYILEWTGDNYENSLDSKSDT
ncbi:MAG: hypothetical protein IJN70_01720 [Clostridia bacterium]|nr:hypothetical protein [Clostridia bacterium]